VGSRLLQFLLADFHRSSAPGISRNLAGSKSAGFSVTARWKSDDAFAAQYARATARYNRYANHPRGDGDDLEDEHDGREYQGDEEPSLGVIENHGGGFFRSADQTNWGRSPTQDREPDGDEEDFSDEGGRAS
jgi:hypothetical protein